MRVVYPYVTNEGFGNNVVTLAKAWLISQSCGMRYQRPAWQFSHHVQPPTPNGYGYYFPTTRGDALRLKTYDLLFRAQAKLKRQVIPTIFFDYAHYAETGIIDVGEACRVMLQQQGLDSPRQSVVLYTAGNWGQYDGIVRARGWVRELLLSHADTRRRFEAFETATAGRLRVGVHIRCGDFAPRTTTVAIPAGERNVRLPLSWYITLCREIRAVADVQFVLQSDGTPDELRDFLDEFQPHHTLGEPYQDMLGALILSACDLALCSNSTYARLAMYMNDKPYIWSAETLYPDQSGRFGYLWREKDRPLPTADRSDPHATRRCYAVSIERPRLPEGARRYLHAGAALPTEIADDLLLRQPVHLFV